MYSIKVNSNKGPKVGPSLISKAHPDLAKKLKKMQVGELCEPFLINNILFQNKLSNTGAKGLLNQVKLKSTVSKIRLVS